MLKKDQRQGDDLTSLGLAKCQTQIYESGGSARPNILKLSYALSPSIYGSGDPPNPTFLGSATR